MIKANELRIGNWVATGEVEEMFIQVCTIGKTGINGVYKTDEHLASRDIFHEPYYDEIKFEDLKAIKLTTDIMLKCGFIKEGSDDNYRWKNGNVYLDQYLNYHAVGGNKEYFWSKYIWHLHKLQNLYFALTGQELLFEYE